MTAFIRQDEYGNRLNWKILRDRGIALYWRGEYLGEDIHWFRQQNYQVFSFDCGRWAFSKGMHAEFQLTLSFPVYYGDGSYPG